jgi:hypothetical protein
LLVFAGVVLLILLAVPLTGESDESSAPKQQPVTAQTTTVPELDQTEPEAIEPGRTPEGCLKAAGLQNVEARSPHLSRGTNADPFFAVIIDRLASAVAAEDAAAAAMLVWTASAGRYLVTGPAKDIEEGIVVEAVSGCLRNE